MAVFDDILESKTAALRSELAAAQAERDAWKMQADENLNGLIEARTEVERLTKEREMLMEDAWDSEELMHKMMARAQSAEAALGKLREAIAPFADFADFLASDEIEGTSPTDELIITFEESGVVLQRFTIAQFDALRALIEKEGE